MKENLECDIIKDLLPNYIEKLTSEATNQSIENHLKDCKDCGNYYNQMKKEVVTDHTPEVIEFKSFMHRTKLFYIITSLLYAMGIIGVLVSFIVDLAVNHYLSWSLIVVGSCVLAYSFIILLVTMGKYRIIIAFGMFTILLLPYLALIEWVVNRYFLSPPSYWFMEIGLPIALMWLGVSWVGILTYKICKWNIFFSISAILVLSFPCTMFTNYIANGYKITESIFMNNIINGISIFGCALLFAVLGIIMSNRKRRK